MTDSPVLFDTQGPIGRITLNRPKALNALDLDMIERIHPQLDDWAEDEAVQAVVIAGAGEKAFCAGGDVKAVWEQGRAGDLPPAGALGHLTADFFRAEYVLNHAIHRYPKPYVALIDGISMGGGVGLSIHGSHRVVTDRTLFAMPETGIGLFPDVGGGWYLAQAPGEVGTYAGLTGARGRAADALIIGYGTHFVARERIEAIVPALVSADWSEDGWAVVDRVLDGLASDAGPSAFANNAEVIDRHFAHGTMEAIVDSLKADGTGFAAETLETLSRMSPTSLKLTLEMIRRYRALAYEEAVTLDFRLVQACMRLPDFYEGIRALLVDKDKNPTWSPATLEAVEDALVQRCFASLGEHDLIVPVA